METWEDVKKELLKDPEFKKIYDDQAPQRELMIQLVGIRIKYGLTQAQLAKKMGTTQSAIARLESGEANPSLRFLQRLAAATDTRLKIEFQPS